MDYHRPHPPHRLGVRPHTSVTAASTPGAPGAPFTGWSWKPCQCIPARDVYRPLVFTTQITPSPVFALPLILATGNTSSSCCV